MTRALRAAVLVVGWANEVLGVVNTERFNRAWKAANRSQRAGVLRAIERADVSGLGAWIDHIETHEKAKKGKAR